MIYFLKAEALQNKKVIAANVYATCYLHDCLLNTNFQEKKYTKIQGELRKQREVGGRREGSVKVTD